MKIITIGDIHANPNWQFGVFGSPKDFQYLLANPDKSKLKYDKYIFIGDYVDSYFNFPDEREIETLNEVIQFKKLFPDNVVLLVGNHDWHYIKENLSCSRYNFRIDEQLREIYNANINLFKLLHIEEIGGVKYLWSHAGICKYHYLDVILNQVNFPDTVDKNDIEQVFDYLFKERSEYIWVVGRGRGGRNPVGSIIWADIEDLYYDMMEGYVQIVGHTTVPYVHKKTNRNGTEVIFVDTFCKKDMYTTERDFLILTK